MASTIEVLCACGCGQRFVARVADRNRGWGRFASKSCKAREQERRTHQYARMNGDSGTGPINFGCWGDHEDEMEYGFQEATNA